MESYQFIRLSFSVRNVRSFHSLVHGYDFQSFFVLLVLFTLFLYLASSSIVPVPSRVSETQQ
jgi:hypothetical protein